MYLLQPFALAAILRTILFTVLSLDDFSCYITIAAADISLRSAHLATYVGLSRAGLELPVGSFFPPPRPVTSSDIVLYVTPVAAASWGPTVEAFNTLLAAVPHVVVVDSTTIPSTRRTLFQAYERYAGLMINTQPGWGLTKRQPNPVGYSYDNRTYGYIHDHFPPSLSAQIRHPAQPLPPSNRSTSVAPSNAIDLEDLYGLQLSSRLAPFEPSSAGYRAPLSAAISLGQCTPYRVLPAQVETTLATDVPDESTPKIDHYAKRILDQLEPEVVSKELVVYEFPPCTEGTCELVVFVKPSEVVVGEGLSIYEVIFLCCHIWFVLWVFLEVCPPIWCICYILFTILVFVSRWVVSQFKTLTAFVMDVCDRLSVNIPTSTDNVEQGVSFLSPTDDLPLSAESIDPTPTFDSALDPKPAPVAPSAPGVVGQSTPSEPVRHKERCQKKVRFDPASIPLPKDDEPWETEPASEPATSSPITAAGPEPATPPPASAAPLEPPVGVPTPSSTVNVAGVSPPNEEGKDESAGPSSGYYGTSAPVVGPLDTPGDGDDGGEWTIVFELGGDGKAGDEGKERVEKGQLREGVRENWDGREGTKKRAATTGQLTHPTTYSTQLEHDPRPANSRSEPVRASARPCPPRATRCLLAPDSAGAGNVVVERQHWGTEGLVAGRFTCSAKSPGCH
ncbi:hypothetical protein RhiJN_09366 [Ceratobasidium sp. AG-Ba]|nr:hypothetical protein RhiJN_09366 [Ceratobasidium sp. AG-Ba]